VTRDLLAIIAESILTPRQSVRRFLDRGPHGIDAIAGLVLLAYVVQALASLIVPGARGPTAGPVLAWHIAGLIFHAILFLLSAALVFGVGRLFGGTARMETCAAGMAWYGFVTSFLTPFVLLGWVQAMQGGATGFTSLLLFGASAIGMWVLAGFVAEMHGFRSTGLVIAALVGFLVLSSFALVALIPAA
jgi:hypothetical protein